MQHAHLLRVRVRRDLEVCLIVELVVPLHVARQEVEGSRAAVRIRYVAVSSHREDRHVLQGLVLAKQIHHASNLFLGRFATLSGPEVVASGDDEVKVLRTVLFSILLHLC